MTEQSITLEYDPFCLPTTQHRAGLAGLLVLIDSMKKRKRNGYPLPQIQFSPDKRIVLSLTSDALTNLLNDLYDVSYEEREYRKKWTKGKGDNKIIIEPKREGKRTDKKSGKEKTVYVYDQMVPRAEFLKAYEMPEPWLKLWREAIWGVIRERDKKRIPYKERSSGEDVSLTRNLLEQISLNKTRDISSSLYIGAEGKHADNIKFVGTTRENFLLHFWPIVMQVYVPETIDRDGKRTFQGFVLTIPDVIDMEGFVDDFPKAIAQLGTEMSGYRPAGSIISVPQEGALEYLHTLMSIAKAHYGEKELAFNVSGVEVYHLQKSGNTVHMLTADRVGFDTSILEQYDSIRKRYHHPLFRKQIILNLLRGQEWYHGFHQVFQAHSYKQFTGDKASYFQFDVRKRFKTDFDERRSEK